jgi:hypothetical protein
VNNCRATSPGSSFHFNVDPFDRKITFESQSSVVKTRKEKHRGLNAHIGITPRQGCVTEKTRMKEPIKNQSRNRKKRAAQRRGHRRNRPTTAIVVGIVVLALVGVAAYGIYHTIATQAEASKAIDGLQSFTGLDRSHTLAPVVYPQTPPVGGAHNPVWLNCGVYTSPVPNEKAVHSLEHGAVWITYQPDLPAAEVQKLQDITRQSGYRLLSPYPDLPSPIVVSAWGYQLKLEQADDPRLMRFILKYEQNPLGPEPGASCTGGDGQPG